MLLHTALETLREPDDNVSTDTLLFECQNSAFDLFQMLFKFCGRTIVQPCRDLFEKATGLLGFHSTSPCFLTKAESESAMATARQHDPIGTLINAVRPNTFGGSGRGSGKNGRRGAKRGAGRDNAQLRHLQSTRILVTPSAPPLTSLATPQQQQQRQHHKSSSRLAGGQAAPLADLGRQQSTPLARGCGCGRGKGQ